MDKLQQLLTDESYSIDEPVTDSGLTALGYLCGYQDSENNRAVLGWILNRGPDVMKKDKMERMPGHLAASSGNLYVI